MCHVGAKVGVFGGLGVVMALRGRMQASNLSMSFPGVGLADPWQRQRARISPMLTPTPRTVCSIPGFRKAVFSLGD